MIYDCPQCRMPQEAGQTVCPYCHAEFDGPVPADAVVPESHAPPAEALPEVSEPPLSEEPLAEETAPEAEPIAEEAASEEEEPASGEAGPLNEAGPTVAAEALSPAPSGPAPYLTPPSYAPPPYSPPLSAVMPLSYTAPSNIGGPPLGRLTRALLIAFPIVLVLVLGGVYLAGALNTDSDTDVVPLPTPAVSAPAPLPAPAPDTSPVTLSGSGSNTNDGTDPHIKLLAGRWVSKADDFYVFSPDGTGSRGSALNPSGDQPFLWGLVQNRLMLYGAKNETLRFNVGPDSDTVFLAPQTGHYVQYSRAKS